MDQNTARAVDSAAEWLAACERILVFTGAGISTESGIPDFRGPNGVWKTRDPRLFTIQNWLADEEFRMARWEKRFTEERRDYQPNAGHRAVARLWRSGRMIGCITQNVDGLHQAGGLPDHAIAELHGNIRGFACYGAGHPVDEAELEARWAAGELDPRCLECGSVVKATVVMFGENLPASEVARAQAWADTADAVVIVGSTLSVYPAAYFPLEVASRGAPAVLINQGTTDHEGVAGVRIDAKAGEVLPPLVDRLIG